MCQCSGWNSGPLDPQASTLTTTPQSTRANRVKKIQYINVDLLILMNFQIWNENYDVSAKMKCEMMKNVLCLHYSDNISCNNSSASQH